MSDTAGHLTSTPWTYPGEAIVRSTLLLPECSHDIDPVQGRRLGAARTRRCERCRQGKRTLSVPLGHELLRWNSMILDSRTPLVSIGSNSSAAVLRRKMGDAGLSIVLPCLTGTLGNIAVGHSAHVSKGGYVPAAPYRLVGATTPVVVAFLDERQLEAMDRTEPNYRRTTLHAPADELILAGGETLSAAQLYVSRWPVLASGAKPLEFATQEEVLGRIVGLEGSPLRGFDSAQQAAAALHDDEGLRRRVTDFLGSRHGAPAGLAVEDGSGPRYRDVVSSWDTVPLLRVTTTPARINREGEPAVQVSRVHARALGLGAHAIISPDRDPSRPGLVVRVHPSDQPRNEVRVDQTARAAIGVLVGEAVALRPASVPRTPVADVLTARRRYVVCRVQAADASTAETEVCLLPKVTLDALGLGSGARVVVEGLPQPDEQQPRTVTVRAIEAPDSTLGLRQHMSGGEDARFPSARDLLAVSPDLPWIFMDLTTRERLGVDARPLAAVRVRAHRTDQALIELREVSLLLAVSAVGIASLFDDAVSVVALLSALVLASGVVGRARLRRRLNA
ncbi:hypothetical protein G7075_03220 [Phycicoccus sp. HDW14]|uniref:hypothetical protein n=1 Tax=Phycicoccus sp. HDW14 TaxID=2714941 RepID=UPI001409AEC2|nr:hypothetical protein [Phycicoccus sp. HDW14]QIM20386.1 hypothetical protein G7075_03220 [Phycicoccus sp. HDW14]